MSVPIVNRVSPGDMVVVSLPDPGDGGEPTPEGRLFIAQVATAPLGRITAVKPHAGASPVKVSGCFTLPERYQPAARRLWGYSFRDEASCGVAIRAAEARDPE